MQADVSLCAPDLRTMKLALVGLFPLHIEISVSASETMGFSRIAQIGGLPKTTSLAGR
jgi:hypothetical protein